MYAYTSLDEICVGYAGDIARQNNLMIEPALTKIDSDIEPGRAAAFETDGKISYFLDDGKEFAGIFTRSYPQGSNYPESTNIPQGRITGLMRKGYIFVKCTNGTPVRGAKVHMYKTANGGHNVGEFSAAADSTYTVEIPNAQWASNGVKDNIAEIVLM